MSEPNPTDAEITGVIERLEAMADMLMEPLRRQLLEAARILRALQQRLQQWEAAAKATDIYDYLVDAEKRMGPVGPRGIREMVAYCSALQKRVKEGEGTMRSINLRLDPGAPRTFDDLIRDTDWVRDAARAFLNGRNAGGL